MQLDTHIDTFEETHVPKMKHFTGQKKSRKVSDLTKIPEDDEFDEMKFEITVTKPTKSTPIKEE